MGKKRGRKRNPNAPWARAILGLRHALGMPQLEFAYTLGCSGASLSDWEGGYTVPGRMAQRAIVGLAGEYSIPFEAPERWEARLRLIARSA